MGQWNGWKQKNGNDEHQSANFLAPAKLDRGGELGQKAAHMGEPSPGTIAAQLLYPPRARFLDVCLHGVQVVGRRDHGKQQQQNAAKNQKRNGTTEATGGVGAVCVSPPDPDRRQGEHQPYNVEQQFHACVGKTNYTKKLTKPVLMLLV